jgi:hypothetical protein
MKELQLSEKLPVLQREHPAFQRGNSFRRMGACFLWLRIQHFKNREYNNNRQSYSSD